MFSNDSRSFEFEFAGHKLHGAWSPFLVYNGERLHFDLLGKPVIHGHGADLSWFDGRDGWRLDYADKLPLPLETSNFGYSGRIFPDVDGTPAPAAPRALYVAAIRAALQTLVGPERQAKAAEIAAGRLGPEISEAERNADVLYLRAVIPFWKSQAVAVFQHTTALGAGSVGMDLVSGSVELPKFLADYRAATGEDWDDSQALDMDEVCKAVNWPAEE